MRNDHSHGSGGHGHGEHDDLPRSNPELLAQMGYETRDIALNTLIKWLFFLGVFIVAMTIAAYISYRIFVPDYAEAERTFPLAHVAKYPPFPQLQSEPREDIINYRQAEDQVLMGKAAMAGQPAGIPVSQAIDMMATQQGISGVTGNQDAPIIGNDYPGSTTGAPGEEGGVKAEGPAPGAETPETAAGGKPAQATGAMTSVPNEGAPTTTPGAEVSPDSRATASPAPAPTPPAAVGTENGAH